MKKRKIAVFAGGWGGEFLHETLAGILEKASASKADIFSFVNYSIRVNRATVNDGETNIFRLPDIADFDGVILCTNSFNRQWEIDYLTSQIKKNNKPCISLEYPLAGIPCISTDNKYGMRELVEHMLKYHGCRDILYISGPKDHPEAIERLETFCEVMDDVGVPYSDGNIAFGDWSKSMIPDILDGWIKTRESYPEAVICANDIMAMEVCAYFRAKNISVPRDVKVTGYDAIRMGQTISTPIASVSHEWKLMGITAFDSLMSLMAGAKLEENQLLKTKFIPDVSCGCKNDLNPEDTDNISVVYNLIGAIDLDSHFRHFYSAVRKADNRSNLSEDLMKVFAKEHIIEGDEFKLCLVPEFFDSREDNSKLPITGYSEKMEMICELAEGKGLEYRELSLKECIFEASERVKKPKHYLFLPLYSEGRTYGFAMLSGPLNAANENQYYIWSRHIMNALDQVRSNMKLAVLWEALQRQSVTDQLTEVYNRHGCEQYIYEEMISLGQEDSESVLFLIDVDKMKTINDEYGHSMGDKCLKVVATALQEAIPKGLSVARFGGDEFLVGGGMENIDNTPEEIVQAIEAKLGQLIAEASEDLPLTVSIGYALCKPENVEDIEKALAIADKNMYAIKEIHHKLKK